MIIYRKKFFIVNSRNKLRGIRQDHFIRKSIEKNHECSLFMSQ